MKFLTTKGIASEIENIIRNAKDFIFIISPYINIDKTFQKRLKIAQDKNIETNVIFIKKSNNDDEIKQFEKLENINLFRYECLHAKCYLNECTAIITSMNFSLPSEKNNCEIGLEVDMNENEELFSEILKECKAIKKFSQKYYAENKTFLDEQSEVKENISYDDGFCIRCHKKIEFNISTPLCKKCKKTWNLFENEDYKERFCHKCGEEFENSSFKDCLCKKCKARL